MPTYILKTSNLKLNVKKKNKIAKEITKEHNKITGANSYFDKLFSKKILKKITLWVVKLSMINKFFCMVI